MMRLRNMNLEEVDQDCRGLTLFLLLNNRHWLSVYNFKKRGSVSDSRFIIQGVSLLWAQFSCTSSGGEKNAQPPRRLRTAVGSKTHLTHEIIIS